jgi:hypothetical protein
MGVPVVLFDGAAGALVAGGRGVTRSGWPICMRWAGLCWP